MNDDNNQQIHGTQIITVVTNDGDGLSYFAQREVPLSGSVERLLSDQQQAVNFRWRTSPKNYSAGFHVAGDPTLLIILSGTITIELRDGQSRCFSAGDYFIAQDYLNAGIGFDTNVHGHRAYVQGDTPLSALHLKLEKR
ncbi:cupin domain-containing protein [Eionea flava]